MEEKILKTTNEKLSDSIKEYTISDEAKKALEERMNLLKDNQERTNEYFTCLQQMICPKCGEKLVREESRKVAFEPVTHKRKDEIKEIVKCECGFEFILPETPKK